MSQESIQNRSIIKYLQSLTETEIYPLLRDLLKSMGYKRVNVIHGSLELGRDIVFMEMDPISRELWRGVQVKMQPLTGDLVKDRGARGIINQCQAALDTPYADANGREINLCEIWLVTPHAVSESTKMSIKGKQVESSKVHIIDGPELCDLIQKYIPDLIESGSKPIEKYLQNLMTFCDSPEEYLSIKMNIHYSVSDVFITPMVAIDLINPAAINEKQPLSRILECEDLKVNLEWAIPLLKSRLLPRPELILILEHLKHIRIFSKAISSMKWYKGNTRILLEELGSLESVLGYGVMLSAEQLPDSLRADNSCTSSITEELIETVEEELAKSDRPEVEILRRHASLAQKRTKFGWAESNPIIREEWSNVNFNRKQFFMRLLEAYRSSIDPSDSMSCLAIEAGEFLFRAKLKGNMNYAKDIETTSKSLGRIISAMDEFDVALRHRYETLWSEVKPDGLQARTLNSYQPTTYQAIRNLAEISFFANAFYGEYNKDNFLRLKFDALTLCSNYSKVIIRGALGMGKTTLLKRICYVMADRVRNDPSEKLPVLTFLSTTRDDRNIAISKIIADTAKEAFYSLDKYSPEEVNWILDGFDEIDSVNLRLRILDWCTAEDTSNFRMILSSRASVLPSYISGLIVVDLLPFSRDQVKSFIGQFPWRDANDVDRLLHVLESSSELSALVQLPLLLTLVSILSQHLGPENIPKRREELYRLLIKLLLGEWDTIKGVQRPHAVKEPDIRLAILRRVAYSLYAMRKRAFTKDEFIALCLSAIPTRSINREVALHLFDDLIRDCILIPLSRDEFGFYHFSIQEYLAAEELSQDIDSDRVLRAVEEYFRSGWWEETLVFYAGIKRDVKTLIDALHKYLTPKIVAGSMPSDSLIRLLTRWLDVADFTKPEDLNPRGTVARALSKLNIGGGKIPWDRFAIIRD